MSFLNSVLSTIGGQGTKSTAQQPNPAHSKLKASGSATSASPSLKRKADDIAPDGSPKTARKQYQLQGSLNNGHTSSVDRSSIASSARPASSTASVKTQLLPTKATPSASVTHTRPSQNAPNSGSGSKQPTKGSFREVLARAQAARAAQSQVGQIKHKTVVRMTKKERMAKEAEAARQGKLDARNRSQKVVTSKKGSHLKAKGPRIEAEREKKKSLDLGYKGTMRSAASNTGSKGAILGRESSKLASKSQSRPEREPGYGSAGPRYRYASYSDEEEGEEEDDDDDDGDDYESDDMEAAGFEELEEEEEASLRYAKKEDLEAQNEENEHKRQKEERKRKLLQLAANKRR